MLNSQHSQSSLTRKNSLHSEINDTADIAAPMHTAEDVGLAALNPQELHGIGVEGSFATKNSEFETRL